MISLDKDTILEVLNEYRINPDAFCAKAHESFDKNVNNFLGLTLKTLLKEGPCPHYAQGYVEGIINALMMVEYQRIKSETESLERIAEL